MGWQARLGGVHTRGEKAPRGEAILVQPARREELETGLADAAITSIELLEHEQRRLARVGRGERRGGREARRTSIEVRDAGEVGRLEEREVEDERAQAPFASPAIDVLALPDPVPSHEQHREIPSRVMSSKRPSFGPIGVGFPGTSPGIIPG